MLFTSLIFNFKGVLFKHKNYRVVFDTMFSLSDLSDNLKFYKVALKLSSKIQP